MSAKELVAGAAVAVGLGLVGYAIYEAFSSDEEAPIIVKNGSLEIIAGGAQDNQWTWVKEDGDNNEPSSPSYSHEPTHRYRDRSTSHWVKIESMQSGSCSPNRLTASGKTVDIEYLYDNGQTKRVKIRRGRSGWIDYRTKVRPPDLTVGTDLNTSRPALIFPDAGYISSISVPDDNWSCTFPNAQADPKIWVCASSKKAECQ